MAKHVIESRCCSTFGMDARARPTAVKGIDRSTGATATKRFYNDDVVNMLSCPSICMISGSGTPAL